MGFTEAEIQAVAEFVRMARMQEVRWPTPRRVAIQADFLLQYIAIPLLAFYVYYVLLTISEEVSIIFPQKWSRGKVLFLIIRYGTCVFIAVQLSREYRNYFFISLPDRAARHCCSYTTVRDNLQLPPTQPTLGEIALYSVVRFACEGSLGYYGTLDTRIHNAVVSLGLCLSALLQVGPIETVLILVLCSVPSIITNLFNIVAVLQYPAEPTPDILAEMGYPCYVPANELWMQRTVAGIGRDVRRYVTFATTAVLLLLAAATLIVRYKGRSGRVVHVLRRDGGIHYVSLAGLRFVQAVVNTPAILSAEQWGTNPAAILFQVSDAVITPILAQRLMINLRKVDYMGSQPMASKLLFAPQSSEAEDDREGEELRNFEIPEKSSPFHDYDGEGISPRSNV
ncbi:hypothetical protein NMY22_g2378 [Coprinellus aureogranulatus]|nr:hypothetical protein NMY22_g2378 [Coprinellus aureogranulatus]